MTLLTPAFLLGLLAIGLPIVLHLSRRRTRQALEFPSLMFIAQVPYRSVRRRRLRDVLLLMLRCLAIGLLATAFARPLLRAAPEASGDSRRDVVLLVDTSFSMAYGERMARAREAALQVLAGLGPGDRAVVVSFAERVEARGEFSSDPALLRQQVAALAPGFEGTRYSTAFKTARSLLLDSAAGAREVVVVGDLQRGDFGSGEEARLPPGVAVSVVDVGAPDEPASNLAITEASLERRPLAAASDAREEVAVSARLLRRGPVPEGSSETVRAELFIGGRAAGTREVELGADGAATVAFEPVVLPADVYTRGEVRVSGDRLEVDNRHRFAVSPSDSVPVLILDGGPRGRTPYLAGALATGSRPRFRIDRTAASEVRVDEIQRARVIVVDDSLARLGDRPRAALVDAVGRGAGVLVVLGRNPSGGLRGWGLPGDEPLEQELGGRSLASIDYDHPVFSAFAAARSGDFSGARFFRYRRLAEGGWAQGRAEPAADSGETGAANGRPVVLARFDDGSAALVETRIGEGRVVVWASTLDAEWGDLVLQPVFLPWVDRLIQHLAGFEPDRPSYRVGQVARVDLGDRAAGEWLVVDPSDGKSTVEEERELLLPIREPGFYEVRPVQGSSQQTMLVAANVDSAESDLSRLDADELRLSVSQANAPLEAATEESGDRAAVEAQRIWWFVLLAVLALLGFEAWLANRKGQRTRVWTRGAAPDSA
ncbi:MAG TPA: BatA domain-containing protein [Thermoanaerobaculia bacterium]|nr:BatA domain-containing protein [Thermoanaerobaculia bacterium]